MTSARCKKCGHEGALPPDDPLTGAKRFECPICGEPRLVPILEAAPASPKRVSRWVGELLSEERPKTIFVPAAPRPRGFVAGSVADLRALYHTTFAVARAGTQTALLSLLVLTPFAALLAGCYAMGFDACCVSIPMGILALAGLWAGPLAAFGAAAFGERPEVRPALRTAVERAPRLALTIAAGVVVAFSAAGPLGAVARGLELLSDTRSPRETDEVAQTLAILGVAGLSGAMALAWFYLRLVVLTHVIAIVTDPGRRQAAIARVGSLSKGRVPMLAVVVVTPAAIVAASSPTPFARQIVEKTFGPEAATAIAILAGLLGGTTAVLLGSAMLASAYAVILATPIEES